MALFKKKKKEEEGYAGPGGRLGDEGALTDAKKRSFFSFGKKKKDFSFEDAPDATKSKKEEEAPKVPEEKAEPEQEEIPVPESELPPPPVEEELPAVPPEVLEEKQAEPKEKSPEPISVEDILVKDELAKTEPEKSAWQPLTEKELMKAEKAAAKEIKVLDKALKKGNIGREVYEKQVARIKARYHLIPPVPDESSVAAPPNEEPKPKAVQPEYPPMEDITEFETQIVDIEATPAKDVDMDDIIPPEIVALEELVELEQEVAAQAQEPVEEAPTPEVQKTEDGKIKFGASRKLFGDKKKQLEEWEGQLKAAEAELQERKESYDAWELRLQEQNIGLHAEVQISQTKKAELDAREQQLLDNVTKALVKRLFHTYGKALRAGDETSIIDATQRLFIGVAD